MHMQWSEAWWDDVTYSPSSSDDDVTSPDDDDNSTNRDLVRDLNSLKMKENRSSTSKKGNIGQDPTRGGSWTPSEDLGDHHSVNGGLSGMSSPPMFDTRFLSDGSARHEASREFSETLDSSKLSASDQMAAFTGPTFSNNDMQSMRLTSDADIQEVQSPPPPQPPQPQLQSSFSRNKPRSVLPRDCRTKGRSLPKENGHARAIAESRVTKSAESNTGYIGNKQFKAIETSQKQSLSQDFQKEYPDDGTSHYTSLSASTIRNTQQQERGRRDVTELYGYKYSSVPTKHSRIISYDVPEYKQHFIEYEKAARQKAKRLTVDTIGEYDSKNLRHGHNYYNDYVDEDNGEYLCNDDRVCALVCAALGVLTMGLIVALLVFLYHHVEEQDIAQHNLKHGRKDCVDLENIIYQRRIADLIKKAAQTEEWEIYRQQAMTSRDQFPKFQSLSHPPLQMLCDVIPSALVGNTTDVVLNITLDIDDIVHNNSDVLEGGEWKPASCISRHRVAIIIPYRDRWNHLKVLLHYLIPMLKRQQIHFRVFVVEQFGNETFNKGRIMNAAFREALKLFDFQCVTFHDVDLVPEDDRNMYSCTEQPKHMSISIDKFQYTLPYQGLVGGVLMFRTEHFQRVNGYSNMYWGWGAEDDDMTTRILHQGLRIYRPPSNIARYKMVKHDGRKTSEVAVRMKLLRSAAKRSTVEGLNNVQYKLVSTQLHELFTHFLVDIGHP